MYIEHHNHRIMCGGATVRLVSQARVDKVKRTIEIRSRQVPFVLRSAWCCRWSVWIGMLPGLKNRFRFLDYVLERSDIQDVSQCDAIDIRVVVSAPKHSCWLQRES